MHACTHTCTHVEAHEYKQEHAHTSTHAHRVRLLVESKQLGKNGKEQSCQVDVDLEVTLSNVTITFFAVCTLTCLGVLITAPEMLPILSSQHAGLADLENCLVPGVERVALPHTLGLLPAGLGRWPCEEGQHTHAILRQLESRARLPSGRGKSICPSFSFGPSNNFTPSHPSLKHNHYISNYQ